MLMLAIEMATKSTGGLAKLGAFSDWLERVSSNPWFYGVIFAVALLDSVVPVVPSETTVILGGIAAGRRDLILPLVIIAGAAGAFAGDNLAYAIGARFSARIEARSNRTEKGRKRLEWARTQLAKRGGSLLITARFIPGGRTIITLASGMTAQPRKRFRMFVGIASLIWATYAAVLGYAFGNRFKNNHNLALLLAFACAISVTILLEVLRWVRHRRNPEAH